MTRLFFILPHTSPSTPRTVPPPRRNKGKPSATPPVPPLRSRYGPDSGHDVPSPGIPGNPAATPAPAHAANDAAVAYAYLPDFRPYPGPPRSTPRCSWHYIPGHARPAVPPDASSRSDRPCAHNNDSRTRRIPSAGAPCPDLAEKATHPAV